MRLSPRDRSTIRETAREVFGDMVRVRVFGSRIDDQARGGDIDLLVESSEILPDRQRKALTFVARLQRRLGDQPFDVLVVDPDTKRQEIHRNALRQGVGI